MPSPESFFAPQTVVFITGASSGIGAALAQHLGRFRCRVGLFARRAAELDGVARSVERAGGTALAVPGDVTRLEEVRSAYARIKADWGPVDVAFLNAGIGQFMPLRRFSAADVQRTLEVNVTGVANGLEVLLPDMLERRGGTIVGTSSLGRYLGFPRSSSYSASKAALSLLLQGVRIEARRYHVRVVTFEPGFVRTPMTAKNKFKMPFSMEADAAAERLCRAVAAGRTVVRFPHLMSIVARLAVILPDAVVERTLSVIRSH